MPEAGPYDRRPGHRSRMKRELHVRICEGPGVKLPRATRPRIQDLQPGEERLLSYAIDLGTEVQAKPGPESGRLVQVKAVKGLLYTTTRNRQAKSYTARNRSEQERLLLVEHPVRPEFRLVETPRPAQTARDVYRFELKVPAGQSKALTVTEEQTLQQAVALTSSPDDQV